MTRFTFPTDQARLHHAVGALQYDIAKRGAGLQHRKFPEVWNVNRFELGLANALWGQANYPFQTSFHEALARNYGSDLHAVDFDAVPVEARRQINRWAKQALEGHVEELVPPIAIDRHTAFVLTNAVALRADWQQPFDPDDIGPGEFTRPDGTTVTVPMMRQEGEFPLLSPRCIARTSSSTPVSRKGSAAACLLQGSSSVRPFALLACLS